jgi:hypothetical protein
MPLLSIGFLAIVNDRRINIIDGIIKSAAPNINLQITALRIPIMAGI